MEAAAVDVEEAAVDKGAAAVDMEAAAVNVEAAVDVAQDRGVSGHGHTMSRTLSGQYSANWLCRYHCLTRESPKDRTTGGRLSGVGVHVWSISREMCSSPESDFSFTHTDPGV